MSSTTIMTLMIMVNVDEYDDVDDLDDENNVTPIPLAFNVEPCFKARLQLLNIRVKCMTKHLDVAGRCSIFLFDIAFYSDPRCRLNMRRQFFLLKNQNVWMSLKSYLQVTKSSIEV